MAIAQRVLLADFALANPLYANARLTVLEADLSNGGAATTTKATLYTAPTGTTEESNPFRLDGDGKLARQVYVDVPVIVRVTDAVTPAHDTGVLGLISRYREEWETGLVYQVGDVIRDAAAGSDTGYLYICATTHTAATPFADDLADGLWVLYLTGGTGEGGGGSGVDVVGTTSGSFGTSSANYIKITGNTSGNNPRVSALGSDATVDVHLVPQGDLGKTLTQKLQVRHVAFAPVSGVLPYVMQGAISGITGTITSGVASAFSWQVNSDVAAAYTSALSQATGGTLFYLNGGFNFGNTGMTGGRVGLNISHSLNQGNTSNASGSQWFHTGIQSQVLAAFRDGGVPNVGAGQLFGMFASSELRPGAKYWNEVKGMELNVSIDRYGSASRKLGLTITTATTDGEEGITEEAYIAIGGKKANATSSIGLRTGLLFGGSAGYWGIPASGSLIEATPTTVSGGSPPAMTAAYGMDLSLVTFGGGPLRSANFAVDGSGNVGTNAVNAGLTLQTVNGISAASAAVASYTVLDGGIFTAIPTFTVAASPGGGTTATGTVATMGMKIIREIVAAGSGYQVDDILAPTTGTGTQAAIRVTEVTVTGGITSAAISRVAEVEQVGTYSVLPDSPFEVSGGSGSGAQFRAGYCILTCATGTAGSLYPQFPAPIVTVGTSGLIRRAKIMPVMVPLKRVLLLAANYDNHVGLTGSNASGPPVFQAAGTDSNIYLRLLGKGTSPTEALRMSLGTSSGSPALFDGSRVLNVRNNPTYSGAITPSVLIQTNAAGSTTNTGQVVHHLFNNIDGLDASDADSVAGLAVYHTVNSGSVSARIALQSSLVIAQDTSDAPGNRDFHQALYAEAKATAKAGGTALNAGGNFFGGNIVGRLETGALYYNSVVGLEVNVAAQTGTSTDYKTGLQIVLQGGDAVDSTVAASRALSIGLNVDSPSSPGFAEGITFGGIGGYWPINPTTGKMIYADPATFGGGGPSVAAAWGIDFSGVAFSSGFLKSTGFLVDGSGNTTVAKIVTATSTPASASATGTAGTITWDTSYLYVCTATDTWKRAAIATW